MLFSNSFIVRIPSRFINMGQTLHNRENKKQKKPMQLFMLSFHALII